MGRDGFPVRGFRNRWSFGPWFLLGLAARARGPPPCVRAVFLQYFNRIQEGYGALLRKDQCQPTSCIQLS
jgi:hypothetical protein